MPKNSQLFVLVVDQDSQTRSTTSELLVSLGYFVADASTYREAITLLAKVRFDAIVSGLVLDEQNGFQLISDAKRIQNHIVTVITSGFAEVSEVAKYGKADLIVQKPFDIAEVSHTIMRKVQQKNQA